MTSARMSIMAGSALALVLATPALAAPQTAPDLSAPRPAARSYSTPGSMPKPSTPIMPSDDGLRFRSTLPASGASAPPPRHDTTPLAPPPAATRAAPPAAPASRPAAAEPAAPPSPAKAVKTEPKPEAPAAQAAPEPAPQKPVAAEPARPPRPVAAPAANAASEAQVSDKLREMISGKAFEQMVPHKPDRDAIAALYQKVRAFKPLWVTSGAPTERAADAIEHLRGIEEDGLDPRDYKLPRLAAASAEAQAEAEIRFTETLLTYVRHAQTGRVHFSRVSPNIDYKLAFDPNEALRAIAASNDLRKTLDAFNPPQHAYRALKEKLAELRKAPAESGPAPIPAGPSLRYARDRQSGRELIMRDPRVPQIRVRLGLPAENNTNYNLALANAVAKFQKAHGLRPDGELGNATLEALNPPSREKQIDAILATMERWRWMPRDLGRTHVVLNIPDFHLRVYDKGAQVWQTRVVVGKPTQATPLLTETMKFITVNPTWNVPQWIIYNELLPIYETSDPQIFERQELKVERNPDGSVRVFQPPGERNALGQIRFNFPNKFLVYQHDTPERYYFTHEKRAYSHGCMRVQDPMKYAEVLLSYAAPRARYTQDSIRHMLGGEEKQIDFAVQIPVHITYQTAFVDDAGKLQIRDDVYGLDAKLLSILQGSERAVADTAIERPADPNFKPTPEQGQRLNSVARNGGVPSPFALFEQLFR